MTAIVILVPSRGRPARAVKMAESVRATAQRGTEVLFLLDADDPALPGYQSHQLDAIVLPERIGYTASLNVAARQVWDDHEVLGAFGDDVLFRTPGWDRSVLRALRTPGIAYGDDLIHGKNHPSAVFMSSAIARALGWLALPATSHQWADDAWKRLGTELGVLRFLPDVIVEHMHPAVEKAEWDETYASVFEATRAERDFVGFNRWVETGLAGDVARARAVLGAVRA